MYSALRRGESIGNLPAWVFRTAHNLTIDRCRQASRVDYVEPEALESLSDAAADTPERATATKERRRALQKAMCLLSPRQRRCLELRAEGLRFREIAEVLDLGIPTVETFLARAVRKLSKEMHG